VAKAWLDITTGYSQDVGRCDAVRAVYHYSCIVSCCVALLAAVLQHQAGVVLYHTLVMTTLADLCSSCLCHEFQRLLVHCCSVLGQALFDEPTVSGGGGGMVMVNRILDNSQKSRFATAVHVCESSIFKRRGAPCCTPVTM